MKVVILAGGYGTRFGTETADKPKPMIEIGGKPILVHLMEYFQEQGHDDFLVLAGYRQDAIKDYFSKETIRDAKSVTYVDGVVKDIVDVSRGYSSRRVTILDTGCGTPTGDRLLMAKEYIGEDPFLLTYGDGLSDVDLTRLVDTFDSDKKPYCVLTAFKPVCQFGGLDISKDGKVTSFREKSKDDSPWINAGFMACDPKVLKYVEPGTMFEDSALPRLASEGRLAAYKHHGHWACMDTQKDKDLLEKEWATGHPFWKMS